MPKIVALEEIPQDKKRRTVVFDDASSLELSLETALAAGFLPGRAVTRAQITKAAREDALKCAEHDALALLRRKDRSETELRRSLKRAGFAEEVVGAVVKKCREWGYLDDRRLAERLVSDSVELKHLGPGRLRRTLRERGIDEETADAARNKLADEQPSLLEQALSALRSKRRSYARLEPEVARRRMIAFLQRRGFDFDTIRKVMEQIGHNLEE